MYSVLWKYIFKKKKVPRGKGKDSRTEKEKLLIARSEVKFNRLRLFQTPWNIVHGILQARILEWVAFPSRGSSQPRDQTRVCCTTSRFFIN